MKISDFPRPPEDNGRGIYWSAHPLHPSGRDLEFWINELTAMHMKWVALLDDGSGSSLELCRRLLDAGMMPVVRLHREDPSPRSIDRRELIGLRKLIAAGVRYIDTNPLSTAPTEQKEDHWQSHWPEFVVDNFIYDADTIISEGGLPAASGQGLDKRNHLIRQVVNKGREALFQNGVWLSIHNYSLNRPLDYPDDPVNQQGKPLTQEEYERWPAWACDHRSLEVINECRSQDKHPGQTLAQDPDCFRYWELAGQMLHDILGYHLPMITTGGGPVVGWGADPRYPKVTPELQRDRQVEIVRFLQEQAPDWYLSCCTWLLASLPLGDWNSRWEQMSWYTDLWNQDFDLAGQLPVVQVLKDLPPQIRPEVRQGTATLIITLLRADRDEALSDVLVELETGSVVAPTRRFQARTDAEGGVILDRIPAGDYRLLVFSAEIERVKLRGGERKAIALNVEAGRRSELRGQITDTNGAPQLDLMVTLHQLSPPRLLAESRTDRNGRYSFAGLPAGKVILRVAPGAEQSTERRNLLLDGWESVEVDLQVPPATALRYDVVKKRLLTPAETGSDNFIFGRVLDENGLALDGVTVRMRWTGAGTAKHFPTVKSGRNPDRARGYFEFIHTPGVFMIDIVDDEIESQVADNLVTADLPGHSRPISYEIIFQRKRTSRPLTQSVIHGRLMGGSPCFTVTLTGSGIRPRLMRLDAAGFFRFGELPAGVYQVGLEGAGIISADIILDGTNIETVEFPLLGQIQGRVLPPDPPATVILTSEQYGIRHEDDTNAKGEYFFSNLPDDTYTLRLKGGNLPARQVICDGRHTVDGPLFNRNANEQAKAPEHITDPTGDTGSLVDEEYNDDADDEEHGEAPQPVPASETTDAVKRVDSSKSGASFETPESTLLKHYLYLTDEDTRVAAAQINLLLDFILSEKAAVGFSAEDSIGAARVTIVGTAEPEFLQALRQRKIPFHQVAGDLENLQAKVEALS
jgi:hypothetical protein